MSENHTFGVQCSNNHICYFDKRIVCTDSGVVHREIYRGENDKEMHRIILKCKECDEELVVEIDCEDYL